MSKETTVTCTCDRCGEQAIVNSLHSHAERWGDIFVKQAADPTDPLRSRIIGNQSGHAGDLCATCTDELFEWFMAPRVEAANLMERKEV